MGSEEVPKQITLDWTIQKKNILKIELFAIWEALDAIRYQPEESRIIVWKDNIGAYCCCARGRTTNPDGQRLIQKIWKLAAARKCALWFEWVKKQKQIRTTILHSV